MTSRRATRAARRLLARVSVGVEVVRLRDELAARVRELEGVLAQIKHLRGLLPMCSYCKCVRNDQDYWQQVETYLLEHSDAQISHGVCPKCWDEIVRPQFLWEGIPVPEYPG